MQLPAKNVKWVAIIITLQMLGYMPYADCVAQDNLARLQMYICIVWSKSYDVSLSIIYRFMKIYSHWLISRQYSSQVRQHRAVLQMPSCHSRQRVNIKPSLLTDESSSDNSLNFIYSIKYTIRYTIQAWLWIGKQVYIKLI